MAGLAELPPEAAAPVEDLSTMSALAGHTEADLAGTDQGGGLLGQLGTAAIGAGRAASFGFSDAALAEMANMVGGEGLRKDALQSFDLARTANPYSNMAGEAAGMLIGGPMGVGEGVEMAAADSLGHGLLGKVIGMGARGATEGALLGYQHEISEATLGDAELNGQKLYSSITKDALLGGALGAGLGAVSGGVSSAASKLRGSRGPMSGAVLDELAGVEGAGIALKEEAGQAQKLVDDLQRAGATSEQAAKMTDDVMTMTRARANSGPLSGLLDDAGAQYIARRAGGNAEMGELLSQGYAQRAQKLAERTQVLDDHALGLKKIGDRVMRAEDALNEVQFKYKANQMARMVDGSKFETQRDTLAKLLQDSDDTLKFWESTASKGGAEGSIKSLRKQWTDALDTLAKVEESGAVETSRDFFIKADKFKRSIDSFSSYGKSAYGLPEAVQHSEMGLRGLGDKWRAALEDEAVWGKAGLAQKEWNATFSNGFARRQDFGGRFAARIDEVRGVPVPEMDAEKLKSGLLKKLGSEADSQQAIKSTEAWISGNRDRIAAIRKHGDLTPRELAMLEDGSSALDEFEAKLGTSKKEGEVIARIEQMQLEEQGKAVGGLLGFGADLITRPLATMERLGALRAATRKTEEAIAGGLERFFGKKGPALVEDIKLRPKADIAKDIGEVKAIAGNPVALDARARQMVGDVERFAPKTAASAVATAKRALMFLAQEAPPAAVSMSILASHAGTPRYSDQQVADWEAKRRAAMTPHTVVQDLQQGKLNRDAIRAAKFVAPALYSQMQVSAQEYITRLASQGKLDKMPRQQQAALASLLEVPADQTWQPDFILMMQAAKATPPPPPQTPQGPMPVTSKRAITVDAGMWQTEAQTIDQSI